MIQPFLDTLYSIAIGLGFTDFPKNPLKNWPAVLFFVFTLVLAALDWYYYRGFEPAIPTERKSLYYILQVVTVLVLSQMFRHSQEDSIRPWLAYFIILNVLGVAWDLLAQVQNIGAFAAINALFILVSALALIYYRRLAFWGIDVRYSIFVGELLVVLLAWPILIVFNK